MRGPIALLSLSTLAMIGFIAVMIANAKPDACPAPSGHSVEGLFAPCQQGEVIGEARRTSDHHAWRTQ
jgi:hypothetical protein